MRRSLFILFITTVLSAALVAQDSTTPADSANHQGSTTEQGSTPDSQAPATMTEMPASGAMPASGSDQTSAAEQGNTPQPQAHDTMSETSAASATPAPTSQPSASSSSTSSSYGSASSGGYGNRAEVFVTGFALFTNSASGNGISQQATTAGGGAAGYRFHLNSRSALEGRYGFSRNSQKYNIGGTVSSIPAYVSEITGSYVYSLPKIDGLEPFVEGGGGIVRLSPGNYANGASYSPNNPGGVAGAGYPPYGTAATFTTVSGPSYTGSTAGIGAQIRPAFAYGIGLDFPAFSRFSFRTEYRGLGYKAADFKLPALHTNAFNILSEPSFGIVFHF